MHIWFKKIPTDPGVDVYKLEETEKIEDIGKMLGIDVSKKEDLRFCLFNDSCNIMILPDGQQQIDANSIQKSYPWINNGRTHTFETVKSIIRDKGKKVDITGETIINALINKGR